MNNVEYAPGPADAEVQKDGERWTLVLTRQLRHAPEKVWEALTDPQHLREWAPFDADGNLGTVGNTVHLTWTGTPTGFEATVKRAEAPRALEYSANETDFRWELEPRDGGTRLTLWTNID